MRLIDNLEELEVGDYISRSFVDMGSRATMIFEIKLSTKKLLQVKAIKYHKEHWSKGRQFITCSSEKDTIILKKVRKTKKKKLKHKLVTYNDDWTIFKIKEMILKKLE